MKRMNLTRHSALPEQECMERCEEEANGIKAILTFDELPTREEILARSSELAQFALDSGVQEAMIGGAPWLMGPLENALRRVGITPVYAFSLRESVEIEEEDGSVRKQTIFRHVGFVK